VNSSKSVIFCESEMVFGLKMRLLELRGKDRTEVVAFLREKVEMLPEGYFKRRMQARVKLLDEVPPEAFWGLVIVILVALGLLVLGKIFLRPYYF